ncbi:MAG: CoA transferase [Acidimicrobiia bacterium]
MTGRAAPATRHATSSVAIARVAVEELCDALGLAPLAVARPGAVGLLAPPVLLPTADGWIQPGPPTAWPDVIAMLHALLGDAHRHDTRNGVAFPDLSSLSAEAIDAEAGAWLLPAVAVREAAAAAPRVAWPTSTPDARGAKVVVLGSAWAAPLAGLALQQLGAAVVRVVDPRRVDPFPLRDALARDQSEVALDLGSAHGRDEFAMLLDAADLVVDGTTPRVLRNAGFDRIAIPVVRIAAFAYDDRPGYGLAAEARGGWAARHDPPRLGRSSVADPVAGLLAALLAVDALRAARCPPNDSIAARISLEEAVGHLFAVSRRNTRS